MHSQICWCTTFSVHYQIQCVVKRTCLSHPNFRNINCLYCLRHLYWQLAFSSRTYARLFSKQLRHQQSPKNLNSVFRSGLRLEMKSAGRVRLCANIPHQNNRFFLFMCIYRNWIYVYGGRGFQLSELKSPAERKRSSESNWDLKIICLDARRGDEAK